MSMDLKEIRKDLHKIPELGFEEYKTTEYIYNTLTKIGGLNIRRFDFPGLIAEYVNSESDEFVMFRCDMDALSIQEKTDCSFSSEHPANMHACGHDIHMTVMIGLIAKIIKEKIPRNCLFLFQPAEEGKGGAKKILDNGILDQYKIKETFTLHVTPDYPVGVIACNPGIIFGIPQEFSVTIKGRSSHVVNYEKGADAISAAVMFYQNILQGLARIIPSSEKYIFHVGKINGGNAMNIVANHCLLNGTFRTFSKEVKDDFKKLMEMTSKSVDKTFNTETVIDFLSCYDPVVNDLDLYKRLKERISPGYSFVESDALLVGEDFGFLTSIYKGLLFWLGAKGQGHSLHSEYFLPSDDAIEVGVETFFSLIEKEKD